MEKCDLCGKKEKKEHIVFYSEEQYNLCWSCYLKWCKYHKPYTDSHKHIKPTTKEWTKMCIEEEKLFKEWFNKQKKDPRVNKKQ